MLENPLHRLTVVGAVRRHRALRRGLTFLGALLATSRRLVARAGLPLAFASSLIAPLAGAAGFCLAITTAPLLPGPGRLLLAPLLVPLLAPSAAILLVAWATALLLCAPLTLRLSAVTILAALLLTLARLVSRLALGAILRFAPLSAALLLALLGLALLTTLLGIRLPLRLRLLAIVAAALAALPALRLSWATPLLAAWIVTRCSIARGRPFTTRLAAIALPFPGLTRVAPLVASFPLLAAASFALLARRHLAVARFTRLPVWIGGGRRCRTRRCRGIDLQRLPVAHGNVGRVRSRVFRHGPILERAAGRHAELCGDQRGRPAKGLATAHEQFLPRLLTPRLQPRLHAHARQAEVGVDRLHADRHRRVGRHPHHLLRGFLDGDLGGEIGDHLDAILHLVDGGRLATGERCRLGLEHESVRGMLRRRPVGGEPE